MSVYITKNRYYDLGAYVKYDMYAKKVILGRPKNPEYIKWRLIF
jgi:hypothetical protein